MGERQSIARKGVRAIDARNSWLQNGSNAAKTSVLAPGLSTDEREHPFVWYFGAGGIDTKNGLKNAKKDPKNDLKCDQISFSPSQAA